MKTYLKTTPYETYKYIRRVPKQLLELTGFTTFRVSLGSNELEATHSAIEFNSAIEDALKLFRLKIPSATIVEKLGQLLPNEIEEKENSQNDLNGLFKAEVYKYLESQKENISPNETRDKKYFYEEVCTALFDKVGLTENPTLDEITYSHLLEFKDIITKLPKRNIQKYRSMKISKIINLLNNVTVDERISARTVNKYIKWLRALFNFSVVLGHLQVNLANSIPLLKTLDDKLQRLALEDSEVQILLEEVPLKMRYLLLILIYTGMRLSELYKCEVVKIDGIVCFSLMDRGIKLKTKSSYRIIPLHQSLLTEVEQFELCRKKVSSSNLARTISNLVKRLNFKDKEKKSLYSLRHKFATELIQKGADSAIVSELLGHAHTTMTLSRYSTGFSVRQLKEVIELL